MLLADVYGILVLLVAAPVLRWAVAPALVAFAAGRQVERLKHHRRAPAG